ncbi:MAG: dependent oxidoreductase [Chitinophagaceae bacterium]|nr:dependent oxidoreductase [Chitinophagaceae bacterium]
MISVWEKETFYAPQDIIIVGSGFVGLWSAFYLKKRNPKLKITIVDRGIIPTGASTRNAGFACFGSLTELLADEQRVGSDKMLELVNMRYQGLGKIRNTFSKKEIDMDMCGGYELFTKKEDNLTGDLEQQIDYLNVLLREIVKKKTFKLADKKISSLGFNHVTHLIRNNLEGYLHSGKLLNALLYKIRMQGVQVLNNIEIKKFEKINDAFEIETNQNVSLSAKQLLICINGFAKQLIPDLDVEPARGQVLLTSPVNGLPWKGTFHYQQGYYYFRNLGDRVLLGGARNLALNEEKTFSLETTDIIQNELERFLKDVVLPGKKFTIENRWSGTMGIGSEKMPILKEISPAVFCCVRMSGMGVALAPVLGEKAARLMTA